MHILATERSSTPQSPRHQQLQRAATQFEAVMLGELMKPLAGGSALGEEDSDTSTNPLQSYGTEAMAGALANSGALGFARTIIHSIEARESDAHANKVEDSAHAR